MHAPEPWKQAAPAIAAALPDLCFLIAPDLRFTACNRPDHADLHAPWATLQGRPLQSIGPPALAQRFAAACTTSPQRLRYALRTQGGRIARFEASIAPLPDGTGWLCMARDLGSVDAEQARYARAMQGAADGLWEWDIAADSEYLSPRALTLLDRPGRFADQLHADDLGQWRAALQSHLQHGAPLDIDLRLAGPAPRWLRCRGWTERDARGQPARVLATLSDITLPKFTEQALVDSQAKFRALFHTVPVGIALFDAASETVIESNDELGRLLGWPTLSVVGQSAAALGMAPLPGMEGRTEIDDRELRPQSGCHLHAKLVAEPLELAGRALLLCVVVDISVQIDAEAALSALAEQLMDQERRTTQGLAQALHDQLGQTLTALRLMLDLGAPEARQQARGLIDQALRDVRQVLVDLRPPLLEDEGLAAALDNELAQRRALHPGVRLVLDAEDELLMQRWPVQVEYALFMIVREGLENALRHARPTEVRISFYGCAEEIELGVADDGSGLDAGFERRPGHLGLIGMRERARAIGATLELGPREGGGTQLTLRWRE
ncbi:signal transduction histidine kinase [Pelomonas saccharophila]|uniref:histidine kinase n=1 Tax=Roseateles saccharophilus TaxID=304 RepID=A0ABU1YK53_ROSSA|nr:ATP-binding protein [Roseateles saccharophilus]MDR7269224.1 signal transduction histidine kinase [Roseateles saccharophilus]